MISEKVKRSIPILLMFILGSCQAPRDNPFDPQSPLYRAPEAPLQVTDLRVVSIAGLRCQLAWTSPAGAYEYKLYYGDPDWDGSQPVGANLYRGELPGVKPAGVNQTAWIDLPPGEVHGWGLFSLSLAGLLSGSSEIIVIEAPAKDREANVNVTVRSIRIARWANPLDWVSLNIDAAVADSDGVDTVWIMQDTSFIGGLNSREDGLHWSGEFQYIDLPGGSVEALVGHPMSLYHRDNLGFVSASGPIFLIRVIESAPQTVFPVSGDTVETLEPELEWQPFNSQFKFTYLIKIVHISESYSPTTVYSDSLISPETFRYQVQVPLPAESRYLLWTVSVMDEFSNESRSAESRFNVRNE